MLPLGPKVLAFNHTAGAMGMSLFFVLPGFLIASTLIQNPDVYDFMVRRLARILPLAYAYAIVVFLILLLLIPRLCCSPRAFWSTTSWTTLTKATSMSGRCASRCISIWRSRSRCWSEG